MNELDFNETVRLIVREDRRYDPGAYHFVREALDFTVKELRKSPEGKKRASNHVNGNELLDGARRFALERFGPLSRLVLTTWGLKRCPDIGEIVFNLIEYGVFSKTDTDKKEDFSDLYTWEEAFDRPFRPQRHRLPALARRAAPRKRRTTAPRDPKNN